MTAGPAAQDGPPPLEALTALFDALDVAGIRYCHWKSNEHLDAALRDHVREALRSVDPMRVGIALTHLDVTARAGAGVARALIDEAYAAVVAPEWAAWASRDPEAAARLRTEVEAVADDAARRIVSGICGAR